MAQTINTPLGGSGEHRQPNYTRRRFLAALGAGVAVTAGGVVVGAKMDSIRKAMPNVMPKPETITPTRFERELQYMANAKILKGTFKVGRKARIRELPIIDNTGSQDPDHNIVLEGREGEFTLTWPLQAEVDGVLFLGYRLLGPSEDVAFDPTKKFYWVGIGPVEDGLYQNPHVAQTPDTPTPVLGSNPYISQMSDSTIILRDGLNGPDVAYAYDPAVKS